MASFCGLIVAKVVDIRSKYYTSVQEGYTAMKSDRDNTEFVKHLINIPTGDETESQKEAYYEVIAEFAGICAMPAYSVARIKRWCKKNKGHRFLETMTLSWLAYLLFSLADKEGVLEEQFKLEEGTTTVEDKKLYRYYRKSGKSMPPKSR